jgi:hypothetical protein
VKIEGSDEFIAKIAVEADGHFVDYSGNYDQRSIEQRDDIVVFLLIVVFFHFEAHFIVERDDLVGQIVEIDEGAFEGLHLH